jgi:lipoic acid synthetase
MDSERIGRNLHVGKPHWLKTKIPSGANYFEIKGDLKELKLATVCQEAKCPNIGECWNTRTATFMLMGDTCTRACRFCNVKTGNPNGWLDEHEAEKVADSCRKMNLKYVVLTMVDRDDLGDGGAAHVSGVVRRIKQVNPGIVVELLAGDFLGAEEPLLKFIEAGVDVYAHNIETVRRLSPRVRDARAQYERSLAILGNIKKLANGGIYTKSALMLGLGEEIAEIEESLRDLKAQEVDFLTVGQYMRPTKKHLPIKSWVPPEDFERVGTLALDLGFKGVASSPLVRSSYRAREFYEKATGRTL